MKKLAFLSLLLCFSAVAVGQQPVKGSGKITGIVNDATTGKPVEFANVALVDPKTGKPIDGSVCDDKGKFTISKIAEGTYSVTITFIGYETNTVNNIVIDKKGDIDLGILKLQESQKVLNEVVVQGQRQLIEEKVDRTVYNAENDKTTAGGDATDVLKRVPMLTVDMDGNVSMRGNQNITVLINNKPSTITAGSVSDALKQIPADQIKSVEVITSPSAKYDAEGSAGIINIITKKNTLQGATLNVDAGVGLRGSNLGLNGSYRKGKMGFSLGGFGRANYNVKGAFENNQTTNGLLNTQTADTRNRNLFGRYTLGWDYDINKNNYMSASVRYGMRNGHNYQDELTRRSFNSLGDLTSEQIRDTETADESGNVDISLDFTHTYEKPQRELSFSTQFSRNNRNNDILNIIYDQSNNIDSLAKNLNESFNQEITAQFDYQTPISTNQMLELGGKQIMRSVTSDFNQYGANGPDGTYEKINSATTSNALNYDQNVTASYLSYTLSTKNSYSFKAGARYEYTVIDASYRDQSVELPNPKIPSYGVLVPSLNVSKKLKNGNTLKLAYNRRIQRPSIQFLNPNLQKQNELSESQGNPELDPEYTNNYELGYSTFIKGTSLNFSAFVRNTTGAIQSIRSLVRDSVIFTTYDNIGQEDAYGLNFFANVNIGSKFSLNGGADVFYTVLDNNLLGADAASNEGWVASGRLFGNYNLGKGWGAQFFSFYRGNRVNLQGSQGGIGMYSLGFRKEFNNKKGSVGFAAENFFTSSMKIRNELSTPTIQQQSVNEFRNMSFRINISYRFGKMGFDGPRPRRKKSVSNDDLKDGGGDGMDAGGQQPQQQQPRGNGGAMPQMAPATPAKTPDAQAKPDTAKATVDAVGTWNYTIETPQGSTTGNFVIKKEGDVYSGTTTSSRTNQTTPFTSVTVSGNELTALYTANFGGNEVPVTIKGTITENNFDGSMSFGQFRTIPLKAKR
jgi:outer membrane receptor protein involved in Fe transport